MKTHNIIFITLALIFSQNVFSTGSDGGNSQPGAQPPSVPPNNEEPIELCFTNPNTGVERCIIVDGGDDDQEDGIEF